jgi:hypothetical protein
MLRLAAAVLILSGISATAAVPPTSLAIIACRVDDLTGQEGRHDPAMAARNWRDLELHIVDGELQCKREVVDLVDKVQMINPESSMPLNPDFSQWAQCAGVAMSYSQTWNEANKGWAVVAAGCPVPIVNNDGTVVDYKLPECPDYLPGTTSRIKCRFDASVI